MHHMILSDILPTLHFDDMVPLRTEISHQVEQSHAWHRHGDPRLRAQSWERCKRMLKRRHWARAMPESLACRDWSWLGRLGGRMRWRWHWHHGERCWKLSAYGIEAGCAWVDSHIPALSIKGPLQQTKLAILH